MKRLNSYYLISIITLVLMSGIFIRTIQLQKDRRPQLNQAQSLIKDYIGSYTVDQLKETLTIDISSVDKQSLAEWVSIELNDTPRFQLQISEFEDEQLLVVIFELDSLGNPLRLEGCEVLLGPLPDNTSGATLGEMCDYSGHGQTYRTLKILLANPQVMVDIETWDTETGLLLKETGYRLEKERQE